MACILIASFGQLQSYVHRGTAKTLPILVHPSYDFYLISTIFSFEHIKFRDKHQRIKILLKILLSSSSSIHAFMITIMTMTMTMVMTMMIKMKMSIFVLMIISSLHSFISGSLHNWRPKAVSTKLFLASQTSILQIT